ncbi:hypothetical protein L3X38_030286 [Prunus dulcis]|uniref:Reverse transcriptase Ty1/copia-type domain-containing protein n=1 Tax=Prunus dulcis TaxID=3755 RepID=A0AAD4VA13_PRUDU|nr:hypothetical protein L3X38_030286 [Prunus dulcis]
MRQPLGFEDVEHPDFVCRLQKSLYGLKQAPRAWNAKFTGYLPALGFCSSPSLIQLVIDDLSTVLDMKDMGTLTYFLGLQITYGSNGDLFVHQTKYCKDLLKRAGMEACKLSVTPCKPHSSVLRNEGSLLTDPTQFRSIVGALQYLTFTRPDIAFAVNSVCQFMQAPTDVHVGLVKRILRYLHGTLEYGLTFTTGSTSLTGYCDADWAGDPNSRRSTTGYVVFLGNNPVSWSSRKQSSVSRSSTEAEYRALANCVADIAWTRHILQDLHVFIPEATTLYSDNLSALALSSNPVFHSPIKHLELDFHFIRERVQRRDLVVQYVQTEEQIADIFTKGLHSTLEWMGALMKRKELVHKSKSKVHGYMGIYRIRIGMQFVYQGMSRIQMFQKDEEQGVRHGASLSYTKGLDGPSLAFGRAPSHL